MSFESIQEILKKVEQPSRYIGTEINSIKKPVDTTRLNMVLAFPDLYDIGTSHFGMQILYNILNENTDIYTERVFAPAIDMENELRENNIPLFSLESQTDLKKFDIIGFSLLYELNYTNILTILDLAGIPFLSKERDESFPLIIAGGPGTFNPEPVADLFDAIVVGDGEKVIIEISEKYLEWKEKNTKDRKQFLKSISKIDGVYIPSFFDVTYEEKGSYSFQILKPVYDDYRKVKKAIVPDLEKTAFPESPIIPFGKPVHDRLRLEISRGCSRGCRFCQAGMIYRPVRERKVDSLINITNKAVCNTGYEDVSLLSLSTADYENLNILMRKLMDVETSGADKKLSFSLPSVRAGKLTPDLMETIKKVRKTGFTIAPEAGTQRLRDVINKGITEEEIITTVENAFSLGWKNIKLYFMIGLPTETEEDLQGIIDLAKKLKSIKISKGKKPNITVSISTFVPKPHTPFQWAKQISEEESWQKIQWLKENLRITGVTLKWGKTNISYLEGIFSRGDRRITPLLINAYKKGCRFDGWNEHFKIDLWEEAISEENISVEFYSQRERSIDEPLAWDIIDTGINKEFFIDELNKGKKGILTQDCRYGDCTGCGICDFDEIKPLIEEKQNYQMTENTSETLSETDYRKIKINYIKTGKSKFFGHLELVNIFTNAIRRAEIPVKYSSGFNPIIKITFNNPLPLGYESYDEFFIIHIPDAYPVEKIIDSLNTNLPEGLEVKNCKVIINKYEAREKDNNKFIIKIDNYSFGENELEYFNNAESVLIEKTNKKGKVRELDLKEFVKCIKFNNSSEIEVDIEKINGITVRPELVLQKIFSLSDELIKKTDIIKLKNY